MANSPSTRRQKKSSSSSKQQQGRQKDGQQPPLRQRAHAVLAKLEKKDPGLKQLLKKAHAYAIFPSVGKAALVVGGAYGRGAVFEKGKMIGFATISQMTIGVQIGGDTFTEILVFHDKHQLDRFKHGHMAFAANASAVLVKAAAAGTTDFKGVTALAYSSGGMLLELALGGQKFTFKPLAGSGGDEEPGGASAKGKDRGAQSSQESEDDEEGSEDDESGGMLGRAMDGLTKVTDMAKEHPIAATVVGAGLTTGLAFLLVRGLRSSVGGSASDSDSEDQEDEESGDDTDARDQSDESSDDEEEDEQDDREEDEDDDRGSSRLRRRSRSRA